MALSMCGVKGCYYLIYKNGGTAYYELNPSLGGAGYFITQARTSGRDNTATNICFNNIRIASVTGRSFGAAQISGIVLLGPVTSPTSAEAKIQAYFNANRFSTTGKPITLSSTGGGTHKILLTDYSVNGVDDKFNILTFTLGGICLD